MSMPKSKRKVNPFIFKIAKVKFGYGNLRADFVDLIVKFYSFKVLKFTFPRNTTIFKSWKYSKGRS